MMMVQFADDQVAICEKKQGDALNTLDTEFFQKSFLRNNLKNDDNWHPNL